jgi:type II secretory pathway component GspD/PulD (secretin)
MAVAFQNKPWKAVLEWLTEQSRLPVIAQQVPTGTFTLVAPPGKSYTLAEVIDLMNEALSPRFRLHRGPASLVLLPGDERPDPTLVATVRPDELAALGRTEVVRVVLPLRGLHAKDLAPEVKKLLSPFGEVSTLANRLVLQDTAGNLRQILKTLQELDADAPPAASPTALDVELIPLRSLPAVRTAQTLKGMFVGPGGPYLEADADRRALIVRGTRQQVLEVKAALQALGDAAAPGTTRIITLERGSALAVAEAVQELIGQARPNPIRVIAPGQLGAPAVRAPAKGTDKPRPPLTLTAMGNKLIVSCDDPPVLALVEELVRMLTQAGGEGDFTVLKLRSGSAVEVARVLTETFNGPPGAKKAEDRVRIVADPTANALVVRATPLDLLTIRHLLRAALDSDRQEAEAVIRTWVIGPLKHAEATDVAKVLTAVYRGEAGRAGFVVTADPRTNSLVLRCTEAVYQDAKHLADQLDAKTPSK